MFLAATIENWDNEGRPKESVRLVEKRRANLMKEPYYKVTWKIGYFGHDEKTFNSYEEAVRFVREKKTEGGQINEVRLHQLWREKR